MNVDFALFVIKEFTKYWGIFVINFGLVYCLILFFRKLTKI